ncbi:hypothetical protein ACWM35_21455 [Neobacillus sp. K501]
MNANLNDLLLYRENEDEQRQDFKQSFRDKIIQAEAELKVQQEVLEKLLREEEAKKAALELQRLEVEERSRLYREMIRKTDDQEELEMLQRAKAANERPVSMSPEEWEWYKKTGRTFTKRRIIFYQSALKMDLKKRINIIFSN